MNIEDIRKQFPALQHGTIYLDGPGGAQVPRSVMGAMTDYLEQGRANLFDSTIPSVQHTHDITNTARAQAAIFMNAPSPHNIVFGANMSTLTAHLSRSIAAEWEEGDEIIVSDLDHFANVSFWEQEAKRRGVTVQRLTIDADYSLSVSGLKDLLNAKTKFVAFTAASNICGSLTPVKELVAAAKDSGALTFVDAVHYAPHMLPDVQDWGADFVIVSAYKMFGPHLGICYGKSEHFERLKPYRVAPAPDTSPDCWETGTKAFENLAGFIAQMEYLASLGEGANMRSQLQNAYQAIEAQERVWSEAFLQRTRDIKGLTIWGKDTVEGRTPTFAVTMDGRNSQDVQEHFAAHHISASAGGFYAQGFVDHFNLENHGGVLRVGAMHYNSLEELERFFDVFEALA